MCLTLVVNILASTTYIQLVFSPQCTAVAPVWGAKTFMYLRKTLVFFTDFYMYLIYP